MQDAAFACMHMFAMILLELFISERILLYLIPLGYISRYTYVHMYLWMNQYEKKRREKKNLLNYTSDNK